MANKHVEWLASEISRYHEGLTGKGEMREDIRRIIEGLVKKLGKERHHEIEKINSLIEVNHNLEVQKAPIQKLRGNYSLEMEYLKKWGIIDPA